MPFSVLPRSGTNLSSHFDFIYCNTYRQNMVSDSDSNGSEDGSSGSESCSEEETPHKGSQKSEGYSAAAATFPTIPPNMPQGMPPGMPSASMGNWCMYGHGYGMVPAFNPGCGAPQAMMMPATAAMHGKYWIEVVLWRTYQNQHFLRRKLMRPSLFLILIQEWEWAAYRYRRV